MFDVKDAPTVTFPITINILPKLNVQLIIGRGTLF